jgi:hypothetical protein
MATNKYVYHGVPYPVFGPGDPPPQTPLYAAAKRKRMLLRDQSKLRANVLKFDEDTPIHSPSVPGPFLASNKDDIVKVEYLWNEVEKKRERKKDKEEHLAKKKKQEPKIQNIKMRKKYFSMRLPPPLSVYLFLFSTPR